MAFPSSNGEGYELQMGRWSRRLAPAFIRFAGTTGALRVLDVGCGTGNLCLALAQDPEIVNVCGLDIAPAYVEFANRRIDDFRVKCQVGNACALPFADASFDHTVSMLDTSMAPTSTR